MKKIVLPRNKNLPDGISLLRALNSKAKPSTLNLGLGKPEEDMPESIRAMIAESVTGSKLDYTENAGDAGIRAKLADKIGMTDAKSLVLAHGAQEALMAALIAVMNPGDEVLVPNPGFLSYPTMVKILGGKPVGYALKKTKTGYHHDFATIKSKITSRTRAIIVSSPGNPTGCDLTDEDFNGLLKLIAKKKIVIISDEVYGMLHFTKPYIPLAIQSGQVISINSFSKSHALTGWRIGFIASENEKLTHAALIAHQYIATCASVPAQRLLGHLLDSPEYSIVQEHYRKHYEHKLHVFKHASSEALQKKTPDACGGFYVFPELPKRENSLKFCEKLLTKMDVLAIPGSVFGKKGEGHIRLSLALPYEKVVQAAHILSQYY